MKVIRNILIVCLVIGLSGSAWAQQQLVQFSGVIHNADTNVVVPYVTVTNLSYNQQTFTANHQGYFSFVAHPGDTVLFSSVGYRSIKVVIPATLTEDRYTAMVDMKAEIKELPMVTPYPWASIDEFNMAFMSLEIADDDIVVAQKNLSPESLAALAAVTPRSAEEIQNFNSMQNHIGLTNKAVNQRMANPLLSPFAWGNLIRQITEGNKSRSKNRY